MKVDDADLAFVLDYAADDLRTFSAARILITGGTGFVGKWLVETMLAANQRLALGSSIVLLTREPAAFQRAVPHLATAPGVTLLAGDVTTFTVEGRFDAIVHAATPASAALNDDHPDVMFGTIVDGMRNVLAIAQASGPIPLLFTSSGAVYGPQPILTERLDENDRGGPDQLDPKSAYHEGKRCAELLGAIAHTRGVQVKVARMFAFVGPHLPLDRHFAIGNFIRDGMAGRPITVAGDGTAQRSYLYAADMAIWLWRIAARATAGRAYNVGSESAIDIAALARAVAAECGRNLAVDIRGTPVVGRPPARYIPSTQRAAEELGLRTWTSLDDAIRRTVDWHRRFPAA